MNEKVFSIINWNNIYHACFVESSETTSVDYEYVSSLSLVEIAWEDSRGKRQKEKVALFTSWTGNTHSPAFCWCIFREVHYFFSASRILTREVRWGFFFVYRHWVWFFCDGLVLVCTVAAIANTVFNCICNHNNDLDWVMWQNFVVLHLTDTSFYGGPGSTSTFKQQQTGEKNHQAYVTV